MPNANAKPNINQIIVDDNEPILAAQNAVEAARVWWEQRQAQHVQGLINNPVDAAGMWQILEGGDFLDIQEDLPKFKIFWGGADVDPSLYDMPRSNKCGRSDLDRDLKEKAEMENLIKQGVPIIGICRGAQLLNVVNGGILVQHIDGHATGHHHWCAEIATGLSMRVSSTHHQMMIAHQDGEILFKDFEGAEGVHWEEVDKPYYYNYVTEVVYYPKTKSLCIQPHPEWMNQDSDFVKWINKFIKQEWNLDPINFQAEEINYLRG